MSVFDPVVGNEVTVLIKGKTLKGVVSSVSPDKNGFGWIFAILMTESGETRSVKRNQIKSFKKV